MHDLLKRKICKEKQKAKDQNAFKYDCKYVCIFCNLDEHLYAQLSK